MTGLSGDDARVLLIATATHHGRNLPSVPSVARTCEDLRTVLLERCGVRPERLRVLSDPADAQTMALAVTEEAQAAGTVLLVYFVGHGLLGPGGELYLAASGTDQLVPGLAEHQALSFSSLRQALAVSRASSIVVVLDCCFSTRGSLQAGVSVPAFMTGPANGIYLIGSAEQLALAPQDAAHTAFTGAFIELLTHGDPRGPHQLTLDTVYDGVFRAMRDSQGPLPRRQAGDRAGNLVIAPNPAIPAQAEPAEEPEPAPGRCPYPGLEAFGIDDADLFFGRGRMTKRILAAVASSVGSPEQSGPWILVGPSGSGKSSLLNAGLLAALRNGGLPEVPGSAGWPVVRLTPGTSPLHRLAVQLNAPTADAAERLREDPGHVVELVDSLLADRPDQRLVVLVDQLEELFTLGQDPSGRTAFLRALTALTGQSKGNRPRGLVVFSLRADFYEQAAKHPELFETLRDRQMLVEPMTAEELREAIEKPAGKAGLKLENGLADVILYELGSTVDGQPSTGALPLLSHAMWATWRRRTGWRLSITGYHSAGGIAEAVATTAEQVYTGLDTAGQEATRHILPRLVRVGEDSSDTARPVEHSALLHGIPDPHVAQLAIERFVKARLLTLDNGTARISHEALLRAWPRLRGWVEADRDWLHAEQQLADDAKAWGRSGRDTSLLYRGNRLTAMRERAARAPTSSAELEPALAAFMEASWQHESRGRRRRRLAKGLLGGLTVLVVIAAGLAFRALDTADRADLARSQNEAVLLSRDVAASSTALRGTNGTLARLLSAAAWQRSNTDEAFAAMAMSSQDPSVGRLTDDRFSRVNGLAFHPDGSKLVSRAVNGTMTLWRTDTWKPTHLTETAYGGGFSSVTFSPDGALFAANSLQGIKIWDTSTATVKVVLDQVTDSSAITFSPDGEMIASADFRKARVWDVATGKEKARFDSPASKIAFAADGTVLTAGGDDGIVHRWDVADGKLKSSVNFANKIQHIWSSPDSVDETIVCAGIDCHIGPLDINRMSRMEVDGDPTVNSDGSLIAVDGYDGFLTVWNTRTKKQVAKFYVGDTVGLIGLTFQPHGSILAAGTSRGVQLWDLSRARPEGRVPLMQADAPHGVKFTRGASGLITTGRKGTVHWSNPGGSGRPAEVVKAYPDHPGELVALSPDGTTVATAASNPRLAEIDLWDLASGKLIRTLRGHTRAIGSLAFSPDGTMLVSSAGQAFGNKSGPDTKALLWDTASGAIHAELTGHTSSVWEVSFSPEGSRVATADESGAVRLWDTRTGRLKRVLHGSHGRPSSLAFDHGGTTLVAAADSLSVWDTRNGRHKVLATAGLDKNESYGDVSLSPDGRFAVLSSGAFRVLIWDLDRDRLVTNVNVSGNVSDVEFASDAWTVAIATASGVKLLNVGFLRDPYAAVCRQAGRELTRKEWATYLPSVPYRSFSVC
ncbi:caspase family protein [Streptomyces sp. NPDC059452]|uniref:caspase, EACC1-associated type n=1 Tax=Streptomyces sp. NPDC059452 TaxID=3346835 RepID=UPI00368A9D9B